VSQSLSVPGIGSFGFEVRFSDVFFRGIDFLFSQEAELVIASFDYCSAIFN